MLRTSNFLCVFCKMAGPNQWGKYFWNCFHLAALGYSETPTMEERDQYREFYVNFGKVLPCGKCRANYARHLAEVPIELFLFGRSQLFDWTVRVHNIVNRELNKPEMAFDMAWQLYTKDIYDVKPVNKEIVQQQKCNYNTSLLMLNVFLLVVLLVAILYKFFIKTK